MALGTIKWLDATKGFVKPNDGGGDVIVHIPAVERAGIEGLDRGWQVSFDPEKGHQGRTAAVNLKLA